MALTSAYETTGPAAPRRVRAAGLIDAAAAVAIAAIVFPFPFVRASVATPVFVASLLVTALVAHWAYLVVTTSLFGRTPGMYLLDLGFEDGAPAPAGVMLWALGAMVTAGPDPERGLAARMSGLRVRSTVDRGAGG